LVVTDEQSRFMSASS